MPVSNFTTPEKYRYNSGFATYQETEALDGALPIGQNSPQKPPFGLYTEKISGSPFQAPRDENQQTWTYRIIPSAAHKPFEPEDDTVSLQKARNYNDYKNTLHIPTQARWDPFDINEELDWVHSMHLLCGAGDTSTKTGLGYFIFTAGKSMDPYSAFSSSDGELLIIPQQGVLDIRTELGCILVRPLEICVIPRGIKYNVSLPQGPARGYAAELHQGVFTLPNLGAIGSSGLANTRDFQIPVASYDDGLEYACKIYCKYNGRLFVAEQDHSPFDVVAWHGLYYPYKYDLGRFLTIGSISYDHPDPSIFTVLASTQGIAELAIFPPRWLVMEDTFRPPWYHRNALAEIMGLIQGEYEARNKGFLPGGASLHNVFVAHGPDATVHDKASKQDLVPQKVGAGSMAFVFESTMLMGMSEWAWETSNKRQSTYNADTWLPLKSHFNGPASVKANSHLLSSSTNGGGKDAADGVGEDY